MKKTLTIALLLAIATVGYSQKAADLFARNEVRVNWLGVDFSHVKLIGDFSQFKGIGEKRTWQIKNDYFPCWNKIIVNEREKYDIRGMLRRQNIYYDLSITDSVNDAASTKDMEGYNNPDYTKTEISKFISAYNTSGKTGIGIVLIAESLNKADEEAVYVFVAFNMTTKEVLIQERLKGEPHGFGLRNYWAGSIYEVIRKIDRNYYGIWWAEYAEEEKKTDSVGE